ncbi:MAG: ABC-F family ATP-binding cassette domain-containing protein [Oligoflexia bacterium]|nr:ABC-F family ATP-binding cassette domain-containing protein [Oligoflexia bacterium]
MAPVLSAQKVSKIFGITPLFSGLTLGIEAGERVAIVGRNGSGKSTFIKILAGLEEPDEGAVARKRDLRLALVPQIDVFTPGTSAYETLNAALPEHAHSREKRIGEIMALIGFRDKAQSVDNMSGGERKRLAIARALIQEPELLLLDEPTNHLDIAGVLWLEGVLKNAPFASVFISHDRYFIQNSAERVVEIDPQYPNGCLAVKGSYADFLETRAVYLEQVEQYRASLANIVRREVAWLRRGAKAQRKKDKARTDQAKDLIAELQGLTRHESSAKLEFSATGRKSKELVKAENLGQAIEGRALFAGLSFVLCPGSKLGVLGPNGSGKTTFLRTVLGVLPPTSGRVVLASRLRTAFLDQMRSGVNRDQTLKQVLARDTDAVVFNGEEIHVAGWARRFLFRSEQLSLPVSKLSGGEQARAILARLMVEPADVLVLDEPTNDLDIQTLEVLEDALLEFPGALILVTHDRALLDRVCQAVVGLSGRGQSELFADHEQWLNWLALLPAERTAETKLETTKTPTKRSGLTFTEKHEYEKIERKISSKEAQLKEIEAQMNDPAIASSSEQLNAACQKLAPVQAEVDSFFARWSELKAKTLE